MADAPATAGRRCAAWVQVRAEAGGRLRMITPWSGDVQVTRKDDTRSMQGRVIEMETRPGDVVVFCEQRG